MRHTGESDASIRFRIAIRDPSAGWAVEIYLAVIVDAGDTGLPLYWNSAIIKPKLLAAPGAAEKAMQMDSHRAVMECPFGRVEGRSRIHGKKASAWSPAVMIDWKTLPRCASL